MMIEAKLAAKRKGAFVMMVEQDLMLARFLAGLYTHKVPCRISRARLVQIYMSRACC